MLDIHPHHEAAHTSRDFLIHIATIVIGLLIAVGLEQTVELVHVLNRVGDTRRALETERLININRFSANTQEFRREIPMLIGDREVFVYLKTHPGAPESAWPARLQWFAVFTVPRDSAWIRAQQDNVLSHMPDAEARHIASLYRELDVLAGVLREKMTAMHEATSYAITRQPSDLTPKELDREVDLIDKSLTACEAVAWELHVINRTFPDFTPVPTFTEMHMDGAAHADPVPEAIRILDAAHAYAAKLEAERGEGK